MKRILFTAASLLTLATSFGQAFSFEKTCYRGAFAPAPAPMWTNQWTEWDPQNHNYPAPTMSVTSNIMASTTWSTGQTVLISGPIFVTNNSILTIQPGVTVLGDKSVAGSALLITKGSKLMANGTVSQPIVFTSNQAVGLRNPGDWGGVVLMGKGTTNNSGGVNNIEGLPISADTQYGGGTGSSDDNDNSGSLRYVRIEFGGYVYQPNQEINGLTFGSVGRGTVIDYVQCSFTNDDAFEWFGGTVNCKHLVSYRNLDDDFDTDYGFCGNVQFGLAVRDYNIYDAPSVSTSEFFESDNDPTGTTATPKTAGVFSNFTCIGPMRGVVTTTYSSSNGHRNRVRIRRNSELKVFNSIFTDQATRGLFIDGFSTENNAMNGLAKFKNNILAGYGVRATEQVTNAININTFVIANANDTLGKAINASNILTAPFNYTAPDYRPSAGSIALSNVSFSDPSLSALVSTVAPVVAANIPTTACIGSSFTVAPLAFISTSTISPNYCSLSWTASPGVLISSSTALAPTFTISTLGTFSITLMVTNENGNTTVPLSITTTTCLDVSVRESAGIISSVNVFPNPAATSAVLKLNSSINSNINVNVIDLTGKNCVSQLDLETVAGENTIELPVNSLANGVYFVTITSKAGKETVKLIVNR
jgi:hypothetical protein